MASKQKNSLRLLIIGATGAGKSSTGNTIFSVNEKLGKKVFKDGMHSFHNTTQNEEFTSEVLGRQVTIADTPGLANKSNNSKEMLKEVRAAIKNSTDSYDALLFVVDVFKNDLVMDDVTLNVMEEVSSNISKKFWDYAVVIFTFEDKFFENQKRERDDTYIQFSVKEYVNKSKTSDDKDAIGRVIKKHGIKAVASINNVETDVEKKKRKVAELFEEIDGIRERNNSCMFGKEDLVPPRCSVM